MTFALWTILAAAVLPYFTVALAKFGGPGYDNATPRSYLDSLEGWRLRAEWAHRNNFEAFPPFAAAVLVSQWTQAPQGRVDLLAGAFILMRVGYTFAYVAGLASARSLLFFGGFACVILLFCAGIR